MPTPGNALNITQTGIQVFDGTSSFAGTTTTQYNTLVGDVNNTIANVVPGTSTWVLTSNGASANPSYQALPFTQMPWTDEAIGFAPAAGNGYFITAASVVATLPASPNQGDTIAFAVDATGSNLTITANTGQMIRIGTAISVAAGVAVNNNWGDSVTLVYRLADTTWIATQMIGTWSVT